ncbi:zinc finger protein 488 [Apteryx mantelli]|uniref:PR domain zinc finger protein 8 n=1 Tax=Apteryx mantelli TaxID=2696672 RepID=A0A8B7JT58_9AVES|nr:PREDICTED: zinc finger protein 488 [Apteryx mantelli mantelli]XP_025917123.1 zinc finger protein 488 [Apteryx rowi]
MELTSLPKFLGTNDNKLLHHHFPDILATVHTTQDIPKEVIFGPCMLQNTLLDTVAFIALKCSDRRNIHYVFKVDVTSVHSPTGLPWMRLVQAAANSKEQNLEAYLKNSQLYYRSTRKINKNEELLVWYDEELSSLLGFNEIKAQSPQNELRCQECNRVFKCEHSYLSHVRFLCVSEKSALLWRNFQDPKTTKSSLAEQTTNFHSLARDLEVKMAARKDAAHGLTGERRAKSEEAENNRSRKTVLLEKTNNVSEEHTCGGKEDMGGEHALAGSFWKLSSGRQSARKDALEQKQSAFTEVRRMKDKLKNERPKESEQEDGPVPLGKEQVSKEVLLNSSGSAFSFVWPTRARGEQKSAFSKPSKGLAERAAVNSSHPMNDSAKSLGELSGLIATTDIMCCGTLLNSKFFASDLCNSQTLQTSITRSNVFPYTSEPWPKQTGGQLQNTTTTSSSSSSSSSSLTLLPPTFTSFGVAAQNWCAKCNLSFRMTSDLVFHMRSHHKKEYSSTESQCKRRREEKLTCPICHEYFRERHHLSRHMTSHN